MRKLVGWSYCVFTGCLLFSATVVFGLDALPGVVAQENMEKLIKTNSCRECDLRGVNLNRVDLAGADLEGADLSRAKLYLANLSGANLKNANLQGAGFGGADLANADLRGADVRGASLNGAYTVGAQFDGSFITTNPYEEEGVTGVEEEVFVPDTAQPKQSPETQEVAIAKRRDFEATPPVIRENTPTHELADLPVATANEVKTEKPVSVVSAPQVSEITTGDGVATLLSAAEEVPSPKTIQPMQAIDVAAAALSQSQAPEDVEESVPVTAVSEENAVIEPFAPAQEIKGQGQPSTMETENAAEKDTVLAPSAVEKPLVEHEALLAETVSAATLEKSEESAAGKIAIMERFLDTNKCYGCDLSEMVLSGKDLEDADLEKADLSSCNLEGVDLENANLKGAFLLHANLRNANLKGADFYKADLSGADLTGADITGAMFDEAQLYGVEGFNMNAAFLDQKPE